MQKKIIALAVAGLVSGAAFAQSNVTIYGVADAGYVYDMDSFVSHTKDRGIIYAGGQNGSRVGFRGTEDLGNGLSVNFRMEAGVVLDTGASDQGGLLMGRWATVGLAGANWGQVEFGRRDTFIDQAVGAANVMKGNTTVGQVTPVFQRVQRYDNLVAYTSPSWSGLQFKAGWSSNAAGQDVVPVQNTSTTTQSASNLRVYATSLSYTNGGLFLAGTYDYAKYQDVKHAATVPGYDSGNYWNLVGSYDFKVVRVNAGYGQFNYGANQALSLPSGYSTANLDTRKQWQLGVSVPFGDKDFIAINYAEGKVSYTNAWGDDKQKLWGVAYFHDLSKRTNLYVAYGDLSQDSDMVARKTAVGLDGQASYQSAFQVGMKHSF